MQQIYDIIFNFQNLIDFFFAKALPWAGLCCRFAALPGVGYQIPIKKNPRKSAQSVSSAFHELLF
jgi:hypothetical protein